MSESPSTALYSLRGATPLFGPRCGESADSLDFEKRRDGLRTTKVSVEHDKELRILTALLVVQAMGEHGRSQVRVPSRLFDAKAAVEPGLVLGSVDRVADNVVRPRGHLHDVEDRLEQLGGLDPRQQQIVELRFFSGLTVDEVAAHLQISPKTVEKDWRMARAWLSRRLSRE